MLPFTRRGFLAASAVPLLRSASPAPECVQPWPRYVSPMSLDLRIPEKHPYLTLSPAQIEHAKQRAAASPWAKQQMARIFADAASLEAAGLLFGLSEQR